jgi:hypothetical protein
LNIVGVGSETFRIAGLNPGGIRLEVAEPVAENSFFMKRVTDCQE